MLPLVTAANLRRNLTANQAQVHTRPAAITGEPGQVKDPLRLSEQGQKEKAQAEQAAKEVTKVPEYNKDSYECPGPRGNPNTVRLG